MKNFDYFSPQNVKEACSLLSQYPEEAKVIAGGQSLLIILKQRLISPSYLIDIKGIKNLDYIRYDEKDGLRIGALTTHRALETSPVVREKFFMLAEMEQQTCHDSDSELGDLRRKSLPRGSFLRFGPSFDRPRSRSEVDGSKRREGGQARSILQRLL